MAEAKEKDAPALRTPKAKKLGLSVPTTLRLPHDDLIKPESMPSQTSLTRHTPAPSPVAPERDYHKVPNSIPREAIPGGLFKGKSKQLYDCLYQMTRGAIVPVRSVRVSRPKLMKKAGIGARVTFETNVAHLCAVGLVSVRQIVGEHEGNEYEVFTPDEISMPSQTSQTTMPSLTKYAQKLDRLVRLETSQTRHTSIVENKDTSAEPKTFLKTNTEIDDDELAPLREAAREIKGKDLSASDREKARELAELLATELKIAAARTTVSSPFAFLTEHLRRRLWKKEKRQLDSEAAQAASAAKSLPPASSSDCPDCFGAGYFYPDGYDKGVARCEHKRLAGNEAEGS